MNYFIGSIAQMLGRPGQARYRRSSRSRSGRSTRKSAAKLTMRSCAPWKRPMNVPAAATSGATDAWATLIIVNLLFVVSYWPFGCAAGRGAR